MGIVVTVLMLLGLMLLRPMANLSFNTFAKSGKNNQWVGWSLIALGAWNSLWHGLRNLDSFWGIAALISGFFMVLAATQILYACDSAGAVIHRLSKLLKPLTLLITIALAVSFILYAVTLIRMNLGLSIP